MMRRFWFALFMYILALCVLALLATPMILCIQAQAWGWLSGYMLTIAGVCFATIAATTDGYGD